MIRRHKGEQPFFAFLGLMDPHPPYRAEQKYLDRIDEGKLSPPIPPAAPDVGKPKMEYALRESLDVADWGRTHFAALRKTYLAMCARVDEQIGTVVQALKDSGQYDNTAIFIFSDHGDFTGDYGLVEKAQNLFPDCLTRVPLLIKPPAGVPVQPGINPQLTELIDFYATALDFAGVESDHTHFGRSLLPTLADRRVPVRDFVCCEGGRLMNEQHCTEEVESYFGIKADDYAPALPCSSAPPASTPRQPCCAPRTTNMCCAWRKRTNFMCCRTKTATAYTTRPIKTPLPPCSSKCCAGIWRPATGCPQMRTPASRTITIWRRSMP